MKQFPEYRVDISNNCPYCVQKNVKINCPNFESVEYVDPSILSVSGDICLVNGGKPVVKNVNVTFHYAWNNSFAWNNSPSIMLMVVSLNIVVDVVICKLLWLWLWFTCTNRLNSIDTLKY